MRWPIHPAADLFPMLTDDELAALAADIFEHGLREPVWLWRDDDTVYLLDGRNRAKACEIAGVPVESRWYDGDDPISFVISENIKRRHLNTGQKCAVAWEAAGLREIQEALERKAAGGRGGLKEDSAEAAHSSRASAKLAEVVGVSGRSMAQYIRVVQHASDLLAQIISGELELNRADRIIRDREAEQKRVAHAKKEAAKLGTIATIDIRHGDFRDTLADLTNIDAIITDPPYPHEFIPLLGDLASWADKVLTDDGILAVLIGQTYLPEVYRLLDTGRPYRWTACYLTSGPAYVSHPRKVQSNWKPLIVYGGTKRRFADVIRSEGTDADAKNNHKWGQDYGAFHTIVERLTERGHTVVDPFMGSGTTLLAAHALGRNAVGCDVDEQHVTKARERLS